MAHNSRVDASGAAFKGSQRQIQNYINKTEHLETLNCAVATALGDEFGGEIEWVSPLQKNGFAELRDGEFINALGLNGRVSLSGFWPSGGPRWDALALARGSNTTEQVFLVEAKSYPREMFGGGCDATEPSLTLINTSLRDTALWLGINGGTPPESWTKSLYQSANRLAHLYFLRRNGIEAFLLNVCFVNDRQHNPTNLKEWREALSEVKHDLGVGTRNLPYVRNIFLPALL